MVVLGSSKGWFRPYLRVYSPVMDVPEARVITPTEARAARSHAQWLDGRSGDGPLDVAQHMLAVQAQNYGAARKALSMRSGRGHTTTEVDAALTNGDLIRTWPMRGTHHIMAAADVRWLTELCGKRALGGVEKRREGLGLSLPEVSLISSLIIDTTTDTAAERDGAVELGNGHSALTRDGVKTLMTEAGVDPDGGRSSHILRYLCQMMELVQGPGETFTAFDNWVPESKSPDAPMVHLVERHLAARAPATVADIAWWSGQTQTAVKKAVAEAAVGEVTMNGVEYLVPEGWEPAGKATGTLQLPAFDEYLMGYKDRTLAVDPMHTPVVGPTKNGLVAPVVVRDGVVIATWKGDDITYLE